MRDAERLRRRVDIRTPRRVAAISQRVPHTRVDDLDAERRRQRDRARHERRTVERDCLAGRCVGHAPLVHDAARHTGMEVLGALACKRNFAQRNLGAGD